DVLTAQVATYREGGDPDDAVYQRICAQLRALALEQKDGGKPAAPAAAPAPAAPEPAPAPAPMAPPAAGERQLRLRVARLNAKDAEAIGAEMALMGRVLQQSHQQDTLELTLNTTASVEDIEAVCCFV